MNLISWWNCTCPKVSSSLGLMGLLLMCGDSEDAPIALKLTAEASAKNNVKE